MADEPVRDADGTISEKYLSDYRPDPPLAFSGNDDPDPEADGHTKPTLRVWEGDPLVTGDEE